MDKPSKIFPTDPSAAALLAALKPLNVRYVNHLGVTVLLHHVIDVLATYDPESTVKITTGIDTSNSHPVRGLYIQEVTDPLPARQFLAARDPSPFVNV